MKGIRPNTMIRFLPRLLMTIAILLVSIPCVFAETRTISWDPVTTYTNGMPIESGNKVNYTVHWTTDSGLGSLHTIGTSLATNSKTFDPDVLGMTRGVTVYFTARAVLSTGEVSALSPAYAWVVPLVTPPIDEVPTPGPAAPTGGRIIKKIIKK